MARARALTTQALGHFGAHGYVRVPGFLGPREVRVLSDAADTVEGAPGVIAVAEADRPELTCRVEDFLHVHAPLEALVAARVAPVVSALFGEPAVVFKEKLNFKRPGGGAFRPHQDYPAFTAFPATYHLTAMLSIDPADRETGCLRFARAWREAIDGLEAPALRPAPTGHPVLARNAGGDIREDVERRFRWRYEPTSPGDLVLFDGFVPHRSEPNTSPSRPRRALFVTFNPRSQGAHRAAYYRLKRADPHNPLFHVGTPTRALAAAEAAE